MPITISGSTGIAGVDGSASTPAVQGTDTNTGIAFPAADTVAVATGGTERMRVDSSGNVGIGTSSPSSKLDVDGMIRVRAIGSEGGQIDINNPSNTSTGMIIDVDSANSGRIFSVENNSSLSLGQLAGTGGLIKFFTAANERVRIDASGNVGIGTSSPAFPLDVRSSGDNIINSQSTGTIQSGIVRIVGRQSSVDEEWNVVAAGSGLGSSALRFVRGLWTGTPSAIITSTGDFQFNSGYGSVATAYGCRAWVNFNGTGTVAIRASGNVSSITDNGVGQYTINFTNALTDANYSAVGCAGDGTNTIGDRQLSTYPTSSSACKVVSGQTASVNVYDATQVHVAIFR